MAVVSGLLAAPLSAQDWDHDTWNVNPWQFQQSPRGPLGVYVKVDIEDAISEYNAIMEPKPPVHTYLRNLYSSLLADRAISGITVAAHWDHIQLSDPFCIFEQSCLGGFDGYDWSYLDDGFEEANSAHKPVQLIITPGFDSPPWLLNKLPSCDGLFAPVPSAPANCGKVDFTGFPEQQRADDCNLVTMFCALPLPWNSVYKEAWWDFLANLSFRYSRNPAFVSVAIAGPIAASDEIILPTTHNETALQLGGMEADDIWSSLINHSFPGISGYQNSDQVFIDQWEQTIHAYERIFSGMTLVLSPDAGQDLPEFAKQNKNPVAVHSDNTLWITDCNGLTQDNQPRSCEAKTEILSYFVTVDGPNGKSTQVGGLTAASAVSLGDIGISGVKVLTSLWPPRSPSFLGGPNSIIPSQTRMVTT
jgi:hypothetical protein